MRGLEADITECKALEEALRERSRKAESASAGKTAFLANMRHEIRTSLNAVIGLSHLLHTTMLDERQQRFVHGINATGKQLLGLLNDILDRPRSRPARCTWNCSRWAWNRCCCRCCSSCRGKCNKKDCRPISMDAGVPLKVKANAVRLKQVLVNLLSNAVKFTAFGSVTLRVCQASLPRSGTGPQVALRFKVSDTGIGIPTEKQAAISDPFMQADASSTRRFGGTGLGLSIVRRLVDGRIELESTPGRGRTSTVMLLVQALPARS